MEGVRVLFSKKRTLQRGAAVRAVDGVSLEIGAGEVLALVGESGSGKTTLGRAAIGLIETTDGRITFHDGDAEVEVGRAKGAERRRLRRRLQMIFQDPFSSIDPHMRVYDALRIPLQAEGVRGKQEVDRRIFATLRRVGLPEETRSNYLFQMSGGQRQRVGVARALLFSPALVVADEPVSMLDASLKGDILAIIRKESSENGVAFLFITHEMPVARLVASRIAVMYLGKIVEIGPADAVVAHPLHPYTQALIEATPVIDTSLKDQIKAPKVPEQDQFAVRSPGCAFHPRCPFAMQVCREREPELKETGTGHHVACWLY